MKRLARICGHLTAAAAAGAASPPVTVASVLAATATAAAVPTTTATASAADRKAVIDAAVAADVQTQPPLSDARKRELTIPAGAAGVADGRRRFVALAGVSLYVHEQGLAAPGRRPTLVLCPDPPNVVAGSYDALLGVLGRYDCHVVAFDLPGFGYSRPRPDAGAGAAFDYSLDAMAACVTELLATLRTDAAASAGASGTVQPGALQFALALPCVAGHVAVRVARAQPAWVHSVVCVQTACVRDQLAWLRRLDPAGTLQTPEKGQATNRATAPAIAKGWFAAATGTPALARQFDAVAQRALSAGATYPLASCFQQAAWLWAGALAASRDGGVTPEPVECCAQRAMVVWGTADRTHAKTDKPLTKQLFTAAAGAGVGSAGYAYHEVPHGHFPEQEAPEQFVALLVPFLGLERRK